MQVRVLLFAQAKDHAGRGEITLELAEGSRVADALAVLEREHAGLAALRPVLATAVDGELVPAATPLRDGAELALLPPVSGG